MPEPVQKKKEDVVEIPPQEPKEPIAPAAPAPSQKKPPTRLEKLKHTKASIDAQIVAEEAIEGGGEGVVIENEDDSKPITVGDLKRRDAEKAAKEAEGLVNAIKDETERAGVLNILKTRIRASGNPQQDFNDAMRLYHSEKNAQIASMRKGGGQRPATRPSGSGAPARTEEEFIPTETELAAARMVGKKSPEDIKAFVLKARAKEDAMNNQ